MEVEVNARESDKPLTLIVGLPDAAVRESSQRVLSAMAASSLSLGLGTNTMCTKGRAFARTEFHLNKEPGD